MLLISGHGADRFHESEIEAAIGAAYKIFKKKREKPGECFANFMKEQLCKRENPFQKIPFDDLDRKKIMIWKMAEIEALLVLCLNFLTVPDTIFLDWRVPQNFKEARVFRRQWMRFYDSENDFLAD